MRRHQILFWSRSSFVGGAVLGGLGFSVIYSVLLMLAAVTTALFLKVNRTVAILAAVLFLVGSLYYAVSDYYYYQKQVSAAALNSFEGKVIAEPRRRINDQSVKVKIPESDIVISAYLSSYPEI